MRCQQQFHATTALRELHHRDLVGCGDGVRQPVPGGDLTAKVADAGDGAAATRYLTLHVTNTGSAPVSPALFHRLQLRITGQVISAQNDRVAASPAHFNMASGAALSFTVVSTICPPAPRHVSADGCAAPDGPGDSSTIHLACSMPKAKGRRSLNARPHQREHRHRSLNPSATFA